MPKVIKISGPPGCGKTTYLLTQIEKACTKYEPDRIGAISFTKAAVGEMRSRVVNLGFSPGDAKNIRTIHSTGYRLLGLDKSSIISENSKHIASWNEAFPNWALPVKINVSDLEDDQGLSSYDMAENVKTHQAMEILRNRRVPLENWPKELPELGDRAKSFYRDWSNFLKENELFDFTLILEQVLEKRYCPEIDVLFVDESQDLSRLQLDVVSMWGENTETLIFIGDSDQAIYRFSGACPEDFAGIVPDWSNVLGQSYRVPVAVHSYAARLISNIKDREKVEYLPTNKQGKEYQCLFPNLDIPGSHMLLTRCNYHLNRWIKYLIREGIPWNNPYRKVKLWNPTETKTWQSVKTYHQLRSGMEVRGEDLREMIGKMSSNYLVRGIKSHRKKLTDESIGPNGLADVFRINSLGWFEPSFFNFSDHVSSIFSLSGASGSLIDLYGDKITTKEPKVIIGTIHSAKGSESDHVWVDTSTSQSIGRACLSSLQAYNDEVRVAYVACTRSKETLGLLYPSGMKAIGIFD